MPFNIHPSAAASFDARALELLRALVPHERRTETASFRPDVPIAHTLTQDDLKKPIADTIVYDSTGAVVARFFHSTGARVGLSGESYVAFDRIVNQMQRTPALVDAISLDCLSRIVFRWLEERYRRLASLDMTAYVLPLAEAEITEYEIWIPIAMLYIQSEFALGRVRLRTLSRELFEHWKGQHPDPGASSWRDSIEHERGETQGLAAATQSVRAERVRAEEMAYRDAAEALAMLRFFAPANFDPRVVSYCTPLGQENLGSRKHLILQNGELRTLVSGSLSRRGARPWIIDDEGLHMLRVGGLELLSNLISAQKRLVASLLLYSRSSLAKEISDKLVYLLVPLESMLLKNNTEPIQQNLAERMAFLIGRDLDERKDIIATVKAAYALRSKFLHQRGHRR